MVQTLFEIKKDPVVRSYLLKLQEIFLLELLTYLINIYTSRINSRYSDKISEILCDKIFKKMIMIRDGFLIRKDLKNYLILIRPKSNVAN
jgi:hypothetical protein